jgi:SAM-dependent methyltransferase
MYLKLVSVYGSKEGGRFYDLGCGVGTLVYTAAFIGTFSKVLGVELLTSLLERGERRMLRWEKMSQSFPSRIRNCKIEWIEDDFCVNTYWTDGSFIFLHWTAFPSTLKSKLSSYFCACSEGTHVVTFSSPLDDPHGDFLLLLKDTCDTSWGKAEFFLHEKITPSRPLEEPS